MSYLTVKLVHIVSATLLFGTGLGTAFFMLKAHTSGNSEAIRVTSRHVVMADWLFTMPAVVVQLATGLWLTRFLSIPWRSGWLLTVLALFVVVGCCWLPVVWIQLRISRLASAGLADTPECRKLMKAWTALGIPAFVLMLALFALMVLRPVLA